MRMADRRLSGRRYSRLRCCCVFGADIRVSFFGIKFSREFIVGRAPSKPVLRVERDYGT